MSPVDPKTRISEGLNRQRVKQEAKRAALPLVVFGGGLVVMALIMGWFFGKINPTFGKETREVRVEVANVFGVFEGFDEVRFRGVPAGTIEKIERDGTQPVLVVSLESKYGPIYEDARAELRPVTPLNDIYLDFVDPGTEDAGEVEGDEALDVAQTTTSVTVPDVLDTLGRAEQRNFHTLLDQLGNGTEDGGARLRRAFVQMGPLLEAAGVLTRQVAEREQATRRLVHNTGVLTTELAERDAQLRELVGSGSAMFSTLHERSPELDSTLAQLGPTFTELRSSLDVVAGSVDDIDAGLLSLYPVARGLEPGLASVRRLNAVLGPAVQRLRRPVRKLVPLAEPLLPAAGHLDSSFDSLTTQLPVIDRTFKNAANCEKGVVGFFKWNTSMSKWGDTFAPSPRGNVVFGVPPVGLPGEPLRQFEPDTCTAPSYSRGVVTAEDTH